MPDLTARYQKRLATVGTRAGAITATIWAGLDHHDEADIPTFAARSKPTLTAAKAAAVAIGVGYYIAKHGARPPAINPRRVPVEPAFRDPFIAFWLALQSGNSFEDAITSGTARADAFTQNFVVSASRRAVGAAVNASGREADHWVRTPDAGACPWCIEVSTIDYQTEEDADIGHDNCGCSIDPVF